MVYFNIHKSTTAQGKRFDVLYICNMSVDILHTGQLLCSKPYIGDPFFERSVVLVTQHSPQGTEGLILNQRIDLENPEDMGIIGDFTSEFRIGGPVANDRCYFLHCRPDLLPNSQFIANDIYFGGDLKVLEHLLNTRTMGDDDIRFYIGISGWEANQLQRELDENTWFVEDAKSFEWITNGGTEMWKSIVNEKGHPYTLYAQGPENPEHN